MKKIALLLSFVLTLTAVFTACGGKKENTNGTNSETNQENKEEVLTAKQYTLFPGDYHCVAGNTVQSDNASVVEVITENMVRAVGVGTAKLTASDGKTTVTHTVTVISLDNVTLGSDYKTVSLKEYSELFEKEIASFMANYATYTEVKDRTTVQNGDKVNIKYVGKMDGKEFEGGSGTYDLVIGSGAFIAGFEDGLIGKEVSTTVDLDLTFPDPYPNNTDFSGKPVVFTVTINSISAPEEYTDEMVKKITGYETIEDFEEYLKTTIVTDMMFTKLTEDSKIENIPDSVKQFYYNDYLEDMYAYLASMGMSISSKSELLSVMGYSEANFDKMVWETLNTTIEQDYIFYKYCAENNISLTKEDYDQNLEKYLSMYNCKDLAELMKNYSLTYDMLYESFLYEKVMKILYEQADIVDDTVTAE